MATPLRQPLKNLSQKRTQPLRQAPMKSIPLKSTQPVAPRSAVTPSRSQLVQTRQQLTRSGVVNRSVPLNTSPNVVSNQPVYMNQGINPNYAPYSPQYVQPNYAPQPLRSQQPVTPKRRKRPVTKPVVPQQLPKKGFWESKTTLQKGMIIAGAGLAAYLGYSIFVSKTIKLK